MNLHVPNSPCPHRAAVRISVPLAAGLSILALALLALRINLWRFVNNIDLQTAYLPWQAYLLDHGRWHSFAHSFSMYFPAYFDLTALTSYFEGHLNRVTQIKLVSFSFDILAAFTSYFLVGRLTRDTLAPGYRSVAQIVAPFCILAGPTVLMNGSIWGQSDIVFTTFLLLSTFALIVDRGAAAALLFGFALAFKLQAVFFVPFLGAMLMCRRLRPWHLLLIPVGWLLSIIPPLLNGANIWQFLKLPASQGDTFPVLAINIGNPWTAAMLLGCPEHIGTLSGILLTCVAVIVFSIWGARAEFQSPSNILVLATLSVLLMPYIMPRMHDRYFFTAEVFLSILSCIDLAFALPAALILTASLISYSSYFLAHLRYSVLAPALLANSAALWLAFRYARLRVGNQKSDEQHAPETTYS